MLCISCPSLNPPCLHHLWSRSPARHFGNGTVSPIVKPVKPLPVSEAPDPDLIERLTERTMLTAATAQFISLMV